MSISTEAVSETPLSTLSSGNAGPDSQAISELAISGEVLSTAVVSPFLVSAAAIASDTFSASLETAAQFNMLAEEVLLAAPTIVTFNDIASESLIATINKATFDAIDVEVLLIDLHGVSDNTPSAADLWAAIARAPAPPTPGPVPIRSTPLTGTVQPYQPVPLNMDSWLPWCALMARAINGILAGGHNTTLASFTLDAGTTTTTLKDSRIGATSVIHLQPITATAAAETWFISSQKLGEATITHSNTSTTDRTFRVLIVA